MSKDNVKNVNLKQCVGTIIFALVSLCVLFIPFTFGAAGINCSYKAFISDESGVNLITVASANALEGFLSVAKITEQSTIEIISQILYYGERAYFVILAADILFALLLIFTRSQILRLIFKIISILFGFAMLAVFASNIIYIAGIAGGFICSTDLMDMGMEAVMSILETSGILFALGTMLFSAFLVKKQFKWFAKLY